MKAPRLRAWHKELKIMELPEDIFTREDIYTLLNEGDYIWMRSAELFDENKKEIYEDDIFDSYGYRDRVIFKDGCFIAAKDAVPLVQWRGDGLKIIGNYYESPELMHPESPPQFIRSVFEGMEELKQGKVEPYKFGEGK
jgi:hypothetical protein